MGWIKGSEEESNESIRDRFHKDTVLILTVLLPLLILAPVLPSGTTGRTLTVLLLSLLLISGVYTMRGRKRQFLLASIFSLITLELLWVSVLGSATGLFVPAEGVLLLFLTHQTIYRTILFLQVKGNPAEMLICGSSLLILASLTVGTGMHLSSLFGQQTILYDQASLVSDLIGFFLTGTSVVTTSGYTTDSSRLTLVMSALGSLSGFLLLALITAKVMTAYIRMRTIRG